MTRSPFFAAALLVSMEAGAADIVFSDGKATVPLPDHLSVQVAGAGIDARFGPQGHHRLQISLLGDFSGQVEGRGHAQAFVREQGEQKGLQVHYNESRSVLTEYGGEFEADGVVFRRVHWQIGVDNCVFTMTFSAPAEAKAAARDFLDRDLDPIINGIRCVAR